MSIATVTPKGYECVQHLKFDLHPFGIESYDFDNPPKISASLAAKQGDDYLLLSSTDGALTKKFDPSSRITHTHIPCFDDVLVGTECKSPNGRYLVDAKLAKVEGAWAELIDLSTGNTMQLPGSFTYTYGRSTFAWSHDSQELYYARVDGLEGLFKIDLIRWEIEGLLPACSDMPFYGAVNPYILVDGRIIFVIQGMEADQYPPPGVYIYEKDQSFHRIAEIPVLDYDFCDLNPRCLGTFSISPDGNWFIYYAPAPPIDTPPRNSVVILGSIYKNQLWDLTSIFKDAEIIQWIEQ